VGNGARRAKPAIARALTHLVDHNAAVERGVFGDLARRRFERTLENAALAVSFISAVASSSLPASFSFWMFR
jgi:hypothetical protein